MTAAATGDAELLGTTERKCAFAQWSRSYDESPNPMLALEERFFAELLPGVHDRCVLDVGCGTGRWLKRFTTQAPRILAGIDFSPEMLDRARRKLGRRATIAVGNATSLPIANLSFDVVMASFLASHLPQLDRFAEELRRVSRPGARIYISDVHPETARLCNWKRGFRGEHGAVSMLTSLRSVEETIATFLRAGFETTFLLEPEFGIEELEIFRSAGRVKAFEQAVGMPAIYLLELRLSADSPVAIAATRRHSESISLQGARVAFAAEVSTTADIQISEGRVTSVWSEPRLQAANCAGLDSLDLDGYLLLPGLINAHDHLEFGLYPNLGRGPYLNAAQWAEDIQRNEKATIALHQSVPRAVRLWWGAIRNLLDGVTTVCHHNSIHPELLAHDFPVRVVTNSGWAHSLSMDPQVQAKFAATPSESPFVLHACEGVDEASSAEILELDQLGVLGDRTVLVHGLALGSDGVRLVNRRRAAVVWCPSSNGFLFGRTHGKEQAGAIDRLLLGSDSPLTAAGSLLDEVRFAHKEVGIARGELYRMLFEKAPAVFRLAGGEGRIRPDAPADFVAVRDRGTSPAEAVADLRSSDVELVIVNGQVNLASEEIFRRLPATAQRGLRPLEVESQLRWIRAPLGRLFREAQRVLGREITLGGKRIRHVCTAWF